MTFTDSQQSILDAVIAVVARDGIEGASMRSVAAEADVSVGLLSYHFDDKQSLIVAAFSRENDRALEALASVTDEDDVGDEQRVRAYIRASFANDLLAPDYLSVRISLWGYGTNRPRHGRPRNAHSTRATPRVSSTFLPPRAPRSVAPRSNDG